MGISMHDKRRTKEYSFYYGSNDYNESLDFQIKLYHAYDENSRKFYTEFSDYYEVKVKSKVSTETAKFLYACDSNGDFTRLECSKIYHMLKDIKLPENYNPDVECYCKKFNVHEAFLEIFGLGRYKYNGVEWY